MSNTKRILSNEQALTTLFGQPQPGEDIYKSLVADFLATMAADRAIQAQAKADLAAADATHDNVLLPLAEGTSTQQGLVLPALMGNQQMRMQLNTIVNDLTTLEGQLTGWFGSFNGTDSFVVQESSKPKPTSAVIVYAAQLATTAPAPAAASTAPTA